MGLGVLPIMAGANNYPCEGCCLCFRGKYIAPDNGLYGEAPPKRGIFSGLSYINEQGNLSLQSVKGPKSAKNQSILWLYKDKKTFWFSYLFNCICTAVKEMQCPPPPDPHHNEKVVNSTISKPD